MPEMNPYQAPQEALTTADVRLQLDELVPWEDDGRRILQAVAKHHRWMMRLYLIFLFGGCCILIAKYFLGKNELLISLQTIPGIVVYFTLIYHVYQLAKRLNKSVTPLISLLVMLLVPYAFVVPIYYHRRAVQCFAHFGIRLGLLGIGPALLDTRIAANYDASLAKAPLISAAEHNP